jgi:hypothetical protein
MDFERVLLLLYRFFSSVRFLLHVTRLPEVRDDGPFIIDSGDAFLVGGGFFIKFIFINKKLIFRYQIPIQKLYKKLF